MTDLNYLHLYYFWVATKERGFLKASKRLGLSQSTVSTQIANLEKQLGCRLIDRGPRRFDLTPEGKMTFEHCESIFDQGHRLVFNLKTGAADPAPSVLRIGFESTIDHDFRKSFLRPLIGGGKNLLRIETGTDDDLIEGLSFGRVDLVLSKSRPSQTADRQFRIRPLPGSNPVLVGKKKWGRKKEGRTRFGAGVPFFLPPAGSTARGAFDSWIVKAVDGRPDVLVESRDDSLLKGFALDGEGIALVPRSLVKDEARAGALTVFHEFRTAECELFAVTGPSGERIPALRKLISNPGSAR